MWGGTRTSLLGGGRLGLRDNWASTQPLLSRSSFNWTARAARRTLTPKVASFGSSATAAPVSTSRSLSGLSASARLLFRSTSASPKNSTAPQLLPMLWMGSTANTTLRSAGLRDLLNSSSSSPSLNPHLFYRVATQNEDEQNNKEPTTEIVLHQALMWNFWDKAMIFFFTIISAGVGLLILRPFFEFRHYARAIESMRIKDRRLQFTGDLADWYSLYFRNLLLSVVTLGVYNLLGHAERGVARYLDANTVLLEPGEVPPARKSFM
ncbi:hypothetical protein QOT17_008232 [Balamuthia mandrillaris]